MLWICDYHGIQLFLRETFFMKTLGKDTQALVGPWIMNLAVVGHQDTMFSTERLNGFFNLVQGRIDPHGRDRAKTKLGENALGDDCMSSKGFGQMGHKNKRGFQVPKYLFPVY